MKASQVAGVIALLGSLITIGAWQVVTPPPVGGRGGTPGPVPSGTGFYYITNGGADAAARAMNPNSSKVTGVLPVLNGEEC